MMKNELTEKELFEIFEKDNINCNPQPSVKSRLDYTFMLKQSQNKIHQNSFAGLFAWIFSFKNIPVKAAMVSAILFFSVFNYQQKTGITNGAGIDSASMSVIPFNLDTLNNRPFSSDTCAFPGS
jgi:hypothetical protein